MSKERLVELLKHKYDHFCDQCGINKQSDYIENLADYLLANGVIVPPCKVGDKVYKPWKAGGKNVVAEFVVIAIISAIKNDWCIKYKKIGGTICYQANIADVGKTVFLTREEAEAKLKESNNDKTD